MGWLWSSGAQPKGNAQDATGAQQTDTEKNNAVAPPKTKTPESTYDDPEIAKFMEQLQSEFGGSKSSSSSNANKDTPSTTTPTSPKPDPSASSSSSSSSSSSWWPSNKNPLSQPSHPTISSPPPSSSDASLDPVAEALLPTTMSCRQAFDHAFHCNSLGGQWTAVYREGTVRSCSEPWEDFWFCMRARAYSSPVKEDAIRDHYRRRELRRYGPGQPSSTDVWEPRTELLSPADAAFRPPEMPAALDASSTAAETPGVVSDEEWRRREIERRREIQRMLREEEERETQASGTTMTVSS